MNNVQSCKYLFDVNRTGGAGGLSSSSDMLYPLLFLCCQSILRCCVSTSLIEPAFCQRARLYIMNRDTPLAPRQSRNFHFQRHENFLEEEIPRAPSTTTTTTTTTTMLLPISQPRQYPRFSKGTPGRWIYRCRCPLSHRVAAILLIAERD